MEIGGAGKRMRAVDGKQEINLEWPKVPVYQTLYSVDEGVACETKPRARA